MKPNIILITTDQQRFDTISRLGNDEIYTPHLDWLVSQGTTYTRCYSDCPICMPSRATIMSGKTSYDLGLTTNNDDFWPLQGIPTIPGSLTQAGYQTKAVGKMHFAPPRGHYGFESMEILQDYYREMRAKALKPMNHGIGQNEMVPVFSTVQEKDSLTAWTVDRSVNFIETRDETRPFFLWTSFSKPHMPLDCGRNYWEMYHNMDFSPPITGEWSREVEDVPNSLLKSTYVFGGAHRNSKTKWSSVKRAYYAAISQIDYNLGKLFSRLRELGLADNTWIIFTSDHGDMLGDHHLMAKSIFLEGSAHVPLIVKRPSKDFQGASEEQKSRLPRQLGGHLPDLPGYRRNRAAQWGRNYRTEPARRKRSRIFSGSLHRTSSGDKGPR